MRFPLEISYPWMLLALAALGLVWLRARDSVALFTPQRRRLSLTLRCVGVTLVVLALSDPRWLQSTDRQHVLWLIDVSRSVGKEEPSRATTFGHKKSHIKGRGFSLSYQRRRVSGCLWWIAPAVSTSVDPAANHGADPTNGCRHRRSWLLTDWWDHFDTPAGLMCATNATRRSRCRRSS